VVKSTTTKLPKLVITKFNGQHTDRLRFWGQFKAEIDNSEASKITKFSYLKELIEPKVHSCIDGLPFTSEGYERVKNILETNGRRELIWIRAQGAHMHQGLFWIDLRNDQCRGNIKGSK
jgi:hypothetical protein